MRGSLSSRLGQLLQGAQEVRVQRVAGGRLQPKLDDVEPVRLLEVARILRHALAGIDVGQHIHFEGERRHQPGNAEQAGRSARHHRESAADQRPAIAAARRDQDVDEARKPLSRRRLFGAHRRAQQRLQRRKQGEAADPRHDEAAGRPYTHLAHRANVGDRERAEADGGREHRGGARQELIRERARVMLEQSRRIVRFDVPRMHVDQRGGGRDHDGQRHERGDDGVRPTEEMGQSHGNCNQGAERENDGGQGAPGAVDDQHQRHQENTEQRHEAHRRRAGLPLEPGVEPRRSDAAHRGERAAGRLEGQRERIDGGERLIALGG